MRKHKKACREVQLMCVIAPVIMYMYTVQALPTPYDPKTYRKESQTKCM